MTFKKPGTYKFNIYEVKDDCNSATGGMSYSDALYSVSVEIKDDLKGNLSLGDVTLTQVSDDKGTHTETVVSNATFTNTYSTASVHASLTGTKHYEDKSGDKPNDGTMFKVRVTALDGGPLPAGANNGQYDATVPAGNPDASISFGQATFTAAMVGHTYTYEVKELVKVGNEWLPVTEAITDPVNGKYVLDGMTYDHNVYTVSVYVDEVAGSDGSSAIHPVVTYPNNAKQLDFYNVYEPTPLVLGDDTNNAIKGTKTLTGRRMLGNETFDFTLSATNEVVSGGYTIANGKASVSGAGEGVAKEFSFGDVTFTKPGTYVFDIDETGHNGSHELPKDGTDGLKFDRHTCTVTVKVVDDNGTLKLADKEGIVYSDGAMAAFRNSYTAKLDLTNGVKVSKTLTGRDMKAGEKFTFAVAAAEGDDAAAKKLAKADESFEVTGAKKDETVVKTALSNLKFNQADANKTFRFVITEKIPAQNPKNGVTYNVGDQEYTVAITIADNGNGTLKANTVITDAKGAQVWTGDLAAAAMTDKQALPFTNSYQASPATSFTEGRFGGNKVLSGRDWLDTDTFTFTLTGEGDAPMPEKKSVELTAADVKALNNGTLNDTDNQSFAFKFGNVTYNTVGEYDYTIEEQGKGTETNGIKYSDNTLKLHVSVTDPGDGQLVAKVTRTSEAGTRTFTNTYSAGIDSYGTAANVEVTKQLKNRDWTKDQFTFIAKPADQDSATKIGRDNTDEFEFNFENGGDANAVVEMPILSDLQFKQVDSGKTFSYTFKEKDGGAKGYTYDGTNYQLDITPHDLGDGKMSVTTKPAEGEATSKEVTWNQGDQPADFQIAFANSYEAVTTDSDDAVKVAATKKLTGRALKDNDFTFAIAPSGETDGKNDIVTAQNKADGTIKFPDINYKASELNVLANQDNSYVVKKGDTWTVSYTAYEKKPAENSGITQEKASFDFTVTVTDDGDGTLSTKLNPPKGDDATTFKNVYGKGASTTATVSATKTLIGRPQKDDEFSFTVKTAAKENAATVATGTSTKGDAGAATLINFKDSVPNEPGVQFTYGFAELNQAVGDGYATYDKDSKTWTVNYVMSEDNTDKLPGGVQVTDGTEPTQKFSVTVKDNGDGTLSKPTVTPAKLKFSNTYSSSISEEGKVTLNSQIKKKFEGRTWNENDEFTFQITSENGGPLPSGVTKTGDNKGTVTIKGNGKNGDEAQQFVQFGAIPFNFDHIKDQPVVDGKRTKEFKYTVTELPPAGASDNMKDGITYDTHTATITVTLTDNGDGTMSGETNIKDGADQGGAQLMAFVKDVDANVFTNVYKSELDYNANGKGGLTINKTLTGRDMTAGQFEFKVEKTQGEDDRLGIAGTYHSKDADNGAASVVATAKSGAKFTNKDDGKTWKYTISELGNDKYEGKGYTYDKTIYTVTVSVKDNGNSTLTVTTTVTDGKGGKKDYIYTTGQTPTEAAVVNFNNTYSAVPEYLGGEGKVSLEATKTLTGRDMKAGEFGFTVYNNKGEEVATGANAAAADGQKGEITFTPIKYTSESLYKDAAERKATASEPDKDGKITYTYTYTVKETSGVVDGVVASKSEFTVTVNVTDNNDGTLSIAVEPVDGGMAFTNTYGEGENGKATVSLSGQKQYNTPASSNAPDIADKFTFKLTGSEGAPMPTKTTATNDAAGNVDFGNIVYTMKNVWPASADETQTGAEDKGVAPAKSEERTKTFDYTVSESGSVPGVTNDATSKTFHVTVKDDGRGNLTVECTDAAGNKVEAGAFKFAFVNTYSTTPVTTDAETSIGGTKELKVPEWSERKLAAGEFNFTLAPVTEGAPMPKNATVTNDADGNFTFGSMTFDKRGTYEYTLTEDKGADASVTYDGSVYTVTVKVEDNGAGALVIESVTYTKNGEPADAAAFVNEYTVDKAGAMLALGAKKDLVGRELKEGEFKFSLTYNTAKGESTVTAANAADGSVTFPEIPFTKPGTYTFTMNEVAGSDKTITYDGTEYKATVTVTEQNADGAYDGKLHASVAYEDGAVPVFKNTYTKPADPKPAPKPEEPKAPTLPQTGDTSALPVVVAAVAGVACIGGGLALSRRRK